MKVPKRYRRITRAATAAGLLALTASAQDIRPDRVSPQETKTASAAMNEFGVKLISNLSASQPHKNIFISPMSVFIALAMTEKGTTGETQAAIRRTLAVPHDVTEEQLHGSASAVLKALDSSDGLSFADALWSDQRLAPAFTEECRKFYRAEATTLDLSKADAAAKQINDWVNKNTGSKIPSIVKPGDVVGSKVVLTNAVYFHGTWSKPFPKNVTQERIFHLADGGEKDVQMMYQRELPGGYRKGDGFEAVALDYRASHIRFYAILPEPGTSPEQALAGVSVQGLEATSGQVGLLGLPRFSLDFSQALSDSLKAMGMGAAFTSSHDFRAMGAGNFSISNVLHRAVLEVDEEGTTASGTTAVVTRSLPQGHILEFDRPFAVVLCDTQTGAILFAGVVYDPGS